MAKKKEKRGGDGTSSFWGIRGTIVVIPEPKGEFRNVFEDVIEQMKSRKDAQSKANEPSSE